MTLPMKISPGTQLAKTPMARAAFQNDVVDVVAAHKEGTLGRRPETLRSQRSSNQVEVKNGTGGDLPRGSVLQLGSYLLDELTPGRWMFSADVPGSDLTSKIAITTRPLPDGKIDKALMGGICIARVDVQDADDTHATPVEGESYLESGASGPFELLSAPDGTGEQELIVKFHAPLGAFVVEGTLDEALAFEQTADMTIAAHGPEGSIEPGEEGTLEVTSYTLKSGRQLPSGAKVFAIKIGENWRVFHSEECDEEIPA